MQYVKSSSICPKKCVFAPKFLEYGGKIMGLETFSSLILFPQKQYTSNSLVTLKWCYFPGKLTKDINLVTFLVYMIDEIPAAILSNLETFSSPEAALVLVRTKNHDLWPGPTPEIRDSRTSRHSAHV